MKKISTFLIFTSFSTFAQQANVEVSLKLNHFLNEVTLSKSATGTNNLDASFNVERLEYFISDIVLTHDGGTKTSLKDVYILVDAFNNSSFILGDYNIQSLEDVSFNIGVSPSVNNGDPSKWPAGLALAPKSPSMYWGWAFGYRFVSFEGYAGPSLKTNYQVHALGNKNYFKQTLPVKSTSLDGKLTIEHNADYSKAINSINVAAGIISHGEVVEHYNSGIKLSPTLDPALNQTRNTGLRLTDQDKKYLVAFLKTLTDHNLTSNNEYSTPF